MNSNLADVGKPTRWPPEAAIRLENRQKGKQQAQADVFRNKGGIVSNLAPENVDELFARQR